MKAVRLPNPPPELELELPLEFVVDVVVDDESPLLPFPRPNPLIAMSIDEPPSLSCLIIWISSKVAGSLSAIDRKAERAP